MCNKGSKGNEGNEFLYWLSGDQAIRRVPLYVISIVIVNIKYFS